ncbi:MAG: PIG-L family deacetylase [Patescibacteria group bacterium]
MTAERLRFTKNKSAIVVVAHPDDETIWMGGFILKHPQMSWTIFSLCRASDSDRAQKFLHVCQRYKARAIITDLEDDGKLNLRQTLPIIKKIMLQRIKNKKFDYIFTHGFNGEYGHPRHIGVYRVVSQLVNKQILKPEAVFYFNYTKKSRKKFAPPFAKKNSDLQLKLTNQKFAQKKKIMTDIYGFAPNSIDVNYCTNLEAFKIKLSAKQPG